MEIKWKSSDVFHLSHLYRDAIHSLSVQLKFNGYLNQKKKKKEEMLGSTATVST